MLFTNNKTPEGLMNGYRQQTKHTCSEQEKHKPVFTSRGFIVGKTYSIAFFESSNLNCTEYTTITPITRYKNLG